MTPDLLCGLLSRLLAYQRRLLAMRLRQMKEESDLVFEALANYDAALACLTAPTEEDSSEFAGCVSMDELAALEAAETPRQNGNVICGPWDTAG